MNNIYSVSDINSYIKHVLTSDSSLRYINVKGEVSNFKIAATGHAYFSIKDENANISVVMFANAFKTVDFDVKNGDEVVILASVDVYVPRGTYQLYAYEMHLFGQGQQLLALEQLKKKLAAEGLFDESRKRPINIYPKAIGLITAKNSAAIKDLLFNIKRRFPVVDIYIFYSAVQGADAPKELLKAFSLSQNYPLDTLIIARGGGASEDLSAFNDEQLVRAVANSKMPVIAAVGHEIDFTLIDFVADKRASTPTGAAELAVIDQREIIEKSSYLILDIEKSLHRKIDNIKQTLLDYKSDSVNFIKNKFALYKNSYVGLSRTLYALNPHAILDRGYAIVHNDKGELIKNIKQINIKDHLSIRLSDGAIKVEVEGK